MSETPSRTSLSHSHTVSLNTLSLPLLSRIHTLSLTHDWPDAAVPRVPSSLAHICTCLEFKFLLFLTPVPPPLFSLSIHIRPS